MAPHFFLTRKENMRQGQTINELAEELTRIRETSRDLIVPTASMIMTPELNLAVKDESFKVNNWAHAQITGYADIPKPYYDRIMLENQNLLATSVNHGFQMAIQRALVMKTPKNDARMLRTVDGTVRGFLSSRYRRLDCFDLLETVFPILVENGFHVKSCNLSDKKMYIKAFTDKISGEVKKGQTINYGLTISSSDVGCGSLQVSPSLYELVCDNGMIMERAIKKYHVGKNQFESEFDEILSDETKKQSDLAFWMEVKDIVNGTMKQDIFEGQLNKLRVAAGQEIKNPKIEEVVELAMREVGITGETIKNSIVNRLAMGNDGRGLNQWGLANAFTWAAHEVEDASYEEVSDLERAGGKIIELPKNIWERLAA